MVGEYVERYAERLCDESSVFAGLDTLLDSLDAAGCPWGVVTNKPEHLTNPLLEQLGLTSRIACAVSGPRSSREAADPASMRSSVPSKSMSICNVTIGRLSGSSGLR